MGIYYSPVGSFTGDARDYLYNPVSTPLPPSVDWRWAVVDIENQGVYGSCVSNALAGACELILAANSKHNHLSRFFLYYEARKHSGLPLADLGTGDLANSGSYLRDNVQVGYKEGIPLERLWKYIPEDANAEPTPEAFADALTRKIDRYERIYDGADYTWTPDEGNYGVVSYTYGSRPYTNAGWVTDIKSALSEGFPLLVAIPVNMDFELISSSLSEQAVNRYQGITDASPVIAGHAICLVGYNDDYQAFIFLNSWGSGWGDQGFGLYPYELSASLMQEAWVIKGFQGYKLIPQSNSSVDAPTFVSLIVDPKYDIPPNPTPYVEPFNPFGVFNMAVLSSDLKWRKSSVVSATPSTNGGVMNYTAAGAITSNVKNNLFPDVSQVERTAGSVTYRKVFLHVDKVSQDELLNARISLAGVTAAGDFVAFYAGTKTDTEATMDATRPYGVGTLAVAATAADTSLTVTPENETWYTAHTPYRVGDLVCVSDGTNADYVTVSAVTYGATVALTVGALTHSFATGVVVATVFSAASTKASYSTPAVTSVAGVFSDAANLIVNDRGSVDDAWTLTFTNSTSFTISGSNSGTVGVGTVGSGASPTYNGGVNTYFQINSTGFSGTFAAGNTIQFATTSATVPLWMSRVVPAGTADISNNSTSLTVQAESY